MAMQVRGEVKKDEVRRKFVTLCFLSGLRYPKVGNGAGLTAQQHHKLEQMSNPQLPDLLNGECEGA